MQPCYVKRIRMRRPANGWSPASALPPGYEWRSWDERDVDRHAAVKYLSFQNSPDANLFANLASHTGCRMLMRCIADSERFCSAATWLIVCDGEAVGTISGLMETPRLGWIQNVGVHPDHRRAGLGRCLVAKALQGYRAARASSVLLEVTAQNTAAARLYRRLGFRPYNIYYRELERRPVTVTPSALAESSAVESEPALGGYDFSAHL